MTLKIELSIPPRILSPNARSHFHAKARATKAYRAAAKLVCMSMLPTGYRPMHKLATVSIDWYTKTRMHPDRDNALASLKSAFDGITDSGFMADDRELTHQPVQFHVDKLKPRVVLTITTP